MISVTRKHFPEVETGRAPFMTECLNRFVPAAERIKEPLTDKEAEAERAYERLRKRLEDET